MYVELAVNLPPVSRTFDYHLPAELEGKIRPGHLVIAPFGKRRVQGLVIGLPKHPQVLETRPIETLVDPEPVLSSAQIELARWLEANTHSSLIECLTLMLPPGLSQRADTLFTLLDSTARGESPIQARIIRMLGQRGALRGRQIDRALGRLNWRPAAEALVRRGLVARTSVLDPPSVGRRKLRTARLAVPPEEALSQVSDLGRPGSDASHRRRRIIDILARERGPLEVTWIYAESGGSAADLRLLENRGLLAFGETQVWRDPLESFEEAPLEPPPLTSDQTTVWNAIRTRLHSTAGNKPILLHGVTGSGKTEIYLRAVQEALDLGRSALVLVPEIALTPQTVRRFWRRFPGRIGLMHSKLSQGERYDTWCRCRLGLIQVVIGARSALFAPLPDIGLIVLDESHDQSYKEQGQNPRHHARETAMAYAEILHALCLLGSATPDIVTTFRAEKGELQRLALPQRILGHRQRLKTQAQRLGLRSRYRRAEGEADSIDLPPVRLVDMRQELRAGNTSLFSRPLRRALARTLEAGEQAILFLNRRGTSTYIFCRDCGEPLRCPSCEAPLTYHAHQEKLLCHRCGYDRRRPDKCPHCGSERVRHFGAGIQKVEAEVARFFPAARTIRWDWDATRAKGSHEVILAHFAAHRADVLVGTQMIAKGLDLPLVTLVGVVSADTALNLPDYRATERTFQVLTQVAGRAGRGLLGGQVVLQSYQPEHYAIQAASRHDYFGFYQQELRHRRNLGYPPYRRLARLVFRHFSEATVRQESERVAAQVRQLILKSQGKAELIGPAPCFFQRIRGQYRWHMVIRAKDPLPAIPPHLPQGWAVDIDPVTLL